MTAGSQDAEYPVCCTQCPHWKSFAAACGHNLNQSLIQEVKDNQTCSVYRSEKTQTMNQLVEDLQTTEH